MTFDKLVKLVDNYSYDYYGFQREWDRDQVSPDNIEHAKRTKDQSGFILKAALRALVAERDEAVLQLAQVKSFTDWDHRRFNE